MNTDLKAKIDQKFQKLISEGKSILSSAGYDGSRYSKSPAADVYQRWRTEALNLVEKVCGINSPHYLQLKGLTEDESTKNNSHYMKECYGIFEAAQNDYKDGLLFEAKLLIRAELLSDFLEQAEYLFNENYYIPAASLAGAILEDSLRKLCENNNIPYPLRANIEVLNTALAKSHIYDKLVQKEITAKAHIRNDADHGKFDNVKRDDVEAMLKWVRRFVTEHLR